jgi:hypothetical protein
MIGDLSGLSKPQLARDVPDRIAKESRGLVWHKNRIRASRMLRKPLA